MRELPWSSMMSIGLVRPASIKKPNSNPSASSTRMIGMLKRAILEIKPKSMCLISNTDLLPKSTNYTLSFYWRVWTSWIDSSVIPLNPSQGISKFYWTNNSSSKYFRVRSPPGELKSTLRHQEKPIQGPIPLLLNILPTTMMKRQKRSNCKCIRNKSKPLFLRKNNPQQSLRNPKPKEYL